MPFFIFYRLESLKEVNSRHEKDLDRVVDDMVHSQEEVGRAEQNIPDFVEKHKFYQDLRGYVTDMVDCYNEKVSIEQTILQAFFFTDAALTQGFRDSRFQPNSRIFALTLKKNLL